MPISDTTDPASTLQCKAPFTQRMALYIDAPYIDAEDCRC